MGNCHPCRSSTNKNKEDLRNVVKVMKNDYERLLAKATEYYQGSSTQKEIETSQGIVSVGRSRRTSTVMIELSEQYKSIGYRIKTVTQKIEEVGRLNQSVDKKLVGLLKKSYPLLNKMNKLDDIAQIKEYKAMLPEFESLLNIQTMEPSLEPTNTHLREEIKEVDDEEEILKQMEDRDLRVSVRKINGGAQRTVVIEDKEKANENRKKELQPLPANA